MNYLERLDGALREYGFARRRRRRIVAEFAGHLDENPAADIGDPVTIAHRFADELGTHRARAAALAAFVALAFAGITIVVRSAAMLPLTSVGSGYDTAALLVSFLAGQIAFAAGGLAVLRALRLRREPTIARREAVVLVRRAGVGLAAGAVTITSPISVGLPCPCARRLGSRCCLLACSHSSSARLGWRPGIRMTEPSAALWREQPAWPAMSSSAAISDYEAVSGHPARM